MKVFDRTENNKPASILGKWVKQKTGRCWAPGMKCENPPIRAHSVQNANMLESIQVAGQVVGIESFLKNGELHVGFRKIGRNKATVFRGLCNPHDTEIFSHLDQNALDLSDETTCLLLTWRAITHEMAAKMEQAANFQSEQQKLIDEGLIDKNTPNAMGMEAVSWMKVLHDFFQYRETQVTPAIFLGNRHRLLFKRYVIAGTGPIFATASFFAEQGYLNRGPGYIAVNAFPMNGDTMVLFTIAREDLGIVMPKIRSLLKNKKLCPILFSAFLLGRVSNFVISPTHFAKWSDDKVRAIEKAFISTIMDSKQLDAEQVHNLF